MNRLLRRPVPKTRTNLTIILFSLFLQLLPPNLSAQTINRHPSGLPTNARHSLLRITKTINLSDWGITIFATDYVSDWELIETHRIVRGMIGAITSPADRERMRDFEIFLVTEADPAYTNAQLRGHASGGFVVLNASSILRYQQRIYFWKLGNTSVYRGWQVHAHELGHSIEIRLNKRNATIDTYNDNGTHGGPPSEWFAWDTEKWFNTRSPFSSVSQVRDGLPNWKREYYESIFDPNNFWGPGHNLREEPPNRNAIPHPTPMIPSFNFNSLLGRYQHGTSSHPRDNGSLTALSTDSEGNPTKLRWRADDGTTKDYDPIYDPDYSLWLLEATGEGDQTRLRIDPAKFWNSSQQAYEIYGFRRHTTYFKKVSSPNNTLPFPNPEIILYQNDFENTQQTPNTTGRLGQLDLTSKGLGNGSSPFTTNQQLNFPAAPQGSNHGSIAYISDHNFIDSVIERSGQLLIDVDLLPLAGAAGDSDGWIGLSLGQSLNNLQSQTSAAPSDSLADLLITYHPRSREMRAYKNGTLEISKIVDSNPFNQTNNLRVHLRHLDRFSSGGHVGYEVFLNGSDYPSIFGDFDWSETSQNYLGLLSSSEEPIKIDNLKVTTFVTPGSVLFSDTFNRPNSTNINGAEGQGGTISNVTYTSRRLNNGAQPEVRDGRLSFRSSQQTSPSQGAITYINNHNFIDNSIIQYGGFEVSVDLASYSTTGSDRHLAVGIGQSLNELNNLQSANAEDSPADLCIAYQHTSNQLKIYRNGTTNSQSLSLNDLPAAYTRMKIKVGLLDNSFDQGASAYYQVFFGIDESSPFTSGTFEWSGTRENFISIASNLSSESSFDNLTIRTLDGLGSVDLTRISEGKEIPGQSQPTTSPDENVLRYAFRSEGSKDNLPRGNNGTFSFLKYKGGTRRANGAFTIDDLTYHIETSTDLKNWSSNPNLYQITIQNEPGSPYMERATATPTNPNQQNVFFRVRVNKN